MHIWKGLRSFHKMFACIRPWRQQKSKNHTIPPGIPEPVSPTFPPTFRLRFAHVSGWALFLFRVSALAWSLAQFPAIYSIGVPACPVLRHLWSSMRKIPWNLQCFGPKVLNAWTPGSCSSFRPKMPQKCTLTWKRRRMP